MSAITEAIARLAEWASQHSNLEQAGATFNKGYGLPGTYTQGRTLAATPEGLAAQFGWSAPERINSRITPDYFFLKYPHPDDHGAATLAFAHKYGDLDELSRANGPGNGIQPFLDAQSLPKDGRFYTFDSGALGESSGAGKRAYPTMYANVLNEPGAFNIKDSLLLPSQYRNNYALASMIGRRPDAGQRLLSSPEQWKNLNIDPAEFANQSPDFQVGALQSEGALQTLRRFQAAADSAGPGSPLYGRIQALSGQLGSATSNPGVINSGLSALRATGSSSADSMGASTLNKLGMILDSSQGSPVNLKRFNQLEYRSGGKVGGTPAQMSGTCQHGVTPSSRCPSCNPPPG